MSARRSQRGGRRGRHGGGEVESEERWLLTYADMITLLMALFMVLFSITSVNKSKLEILSKTLQEAFSGKVLPGGESIRDTGANPKADQTPSPQPPIPAITALVGTDSNAQNADAKAKAKEQEDFRRLKRQIDSYARQKGLQNQVQTIIAQRGLVIRLLTDKVLFDSGAAELKPQATPVLSQVASILSKEAVHQVMVEGHTDNVPIRGSVFPTNWELSTARASRVVRFLIAGGVTEGRLSAGGYASLHPIASNNTAAGRSRNRRVEIVLLRSGQEGTANQGGDKP
ncbi:MAG: chemotaxis protein MotB [Pseudonocardiales bacterium]|jgi:chemotaxis protein MotB|nr:chemotaxis protein MotB [Pseudonocardiales bacterium]